MTERKTERPTEERMIDRIKNNTINGIKTQITEASLKGKSKIYLEKQPEYVINYFANEGFNIYTERNRYCIIEWNK